MSEISMVDLERQYLLIKEEIDAAIQEVLLKTAFINGPQVKSFANNLSAYLQGAHVTPCANGTDALQIAMMALDLPKGGEIIVPSFTYVATAEVIALLGYKPVFADVDPDTFNLSADQVQKLITKSTVAVVPVHLFGQCADMQPIMSLAQEHKIAVIEDAAQALGTRYIMGTDTLFAGAVGDIGTTSFFPSKNLGCYGDGGALITRDAALAEKAHIIANHGQRVKYHHDVVGVNSRLDTLQAAILDVKLKYFDRYLANRNQVAALYDEAFSDISEIQIPARKEYSTHSFHQYTITIKSDKRDALKAHLQVKGIPSMIYYPLPLHKQKAYAEWFDPKNPLPNSEFLCDHVLSLPIHTEMKPKEMEYIADQVVNFFK